MATDKHMNENNAVVTDYQHEREEFPLGRLVHISTVTHAFRGTLKAVTPSHYWLAAAVLVESTGEVAAYAKSHKASEEGAVIKGSIRIPRAAVAWELVFDE